MKIEWKKIKEFPSYEVSTDGMVRRVVRAKYGGFSSVGMIIKSRLCGDGYYKVRLSNDVRKEKNIPTSRLVLLTFCGDPPLGKPHAAHNDGDKANNRLSNLRWVSPKENGQDKVLHGHSPRGEKNPKNRLRESQVIEILKSPSGYKELSKKYGVDRSTIGLIKRRVNWSHLNI